MFVMANTFDYPCRIGGYVREIGCERGMRAGGGEWATHTLLFVNILNSERAHLPTLIMQLNFFYCRYNFISFSHARTYYNANTERRNDLKIK